MATTGRGTSSASRTTPPAHATAAPASHTTASPSPGGAAAGTGPSTATPSAASAAPARPLSRREIESQLLAPDASMRDIVGPITDQLEGEGVTQVDFDSRFGNADAIKRAIINKWCAQGAEPQTVKRFASNDPIAVQKFADVDAEAYLENPSLKADYYKEMHSRIASGGVDRNRVYPVMKTVTYGGYTFQGRRVPAAEVSPFSSRNQSVAKMYEHMNAATKAVIDGLLHDAARRARIPAGDVAAFVNDERRRRRAFRHWLKTQAKPHKAMVQGQRLSDYPTWYHPGSIQPTAPAGGLAYNQMMTLGALQPEWYPEGTATLNITKHNVAARELRKPTAFDGMASTLWVARNQPGQTYGVTGGGAGEFLEKDVTYGEVTAATVSIRSDDFVEEIQRLAADAETKNSSVMEEALRGNAQGTSESTHLHQRIIDRTTREAHSPSDTALQPIAGSTTPRTGASVSPSPQAATAGGTFDRSRQTPVR